MGKNAGGKNAGGNSPEDGVRPLGGDYRRWTRKRLECEMVVVAYSDSEIYRERFNAVVRPMEERMKAGVEPRPDDLDRLASLALFFEAAALVRALGPGALSRMRDKDIKTVALCLGLGPDWPEDMDNAMGGSGRVGSEEKDHD
jgi:hypothetical protein